MNSRHYAEADIEDLVVRYEPILWSWPLEIARQHRDLLHRAECGELGGNEKLAFATYCELMNRYADENGKLSVGPKRWPTTTPRVIHSWSLKWSNLEQPLFRRGSQLENDFGDSRFEKRKELFRKLLEISRLETVSGAERTCEFCDWIKPRAVREVAERSAAPAEKKQIRRLLDLLTKRRQLADNILNVPGCGVLEKRVVRELEREISTPEVDRVARLKSHRLADMRGKGFRWRHDSKPFFKIEFRRDAKEFRTDLYRALALVPLA